MLAIAAADLGMVAAWTTWWHLGTFSGDDGFANILRRTVAFLGWTFVPCLAIAVALVALTMPFVRRLPERSQAWVSMLLTLVAPPLWAVAYCWHGDSLDYIPTAALVAEGAWIVTLQPLWVYLTVLRAGRGRR